MKEVSFSVVVLFIAHYAYYAHVCICLTFARVSPQLMKYIGPFILQRIIRSPFHLDVARPTFVATRKTSHRGTRPSGSWRPRAFEEVVCGLFKYVFGYDEFLFDT